MRNKIIWMIGLFLIVCMGLVSAQVENILPYDINRNVLPQGEIDNQTMDEDGFYSFDINDYITDPDGDNLTATIAYENTDEVDCNVINGINITLTPATNWNGAANCIINISDGTGSVDKSCYIRVNPVNDAPDITSTHVTTAIKDEEYSYDVDAYDPENDTIEYSLTTSPSGMSIDSSSGQITWTPDSTGDFDVTLVVSDRLSITIDAFSIEVSESGLGDVLDITDVKADPDDVKPGEEVTITVEIKNRGDFDLEDIELAVWFVDGDGNKLEDDDGDDIEDDSEFDLDEDEDEDDIDEDYTTFTFTMPVDVDDNDKYYVHVEADGYDDDGTRYSDEDESESITFEKKKHELDFYELDATPSTVRCSRDITLDVGIRNIGSKDEDDVELTIRNSALGINEAETFDLDKDPDDDDNEFEESYRFLIGDDVSAGVYKISVEAEYDDGDEKITEYVTIIVEDCVAVGGYDEEEDVFETEYSIPPTTEPATTTAQTVPFMESSEYLTLMTIATIVLIGVLVFVTCFLFITLKRKR